MLLHPLESAFIQMLMFSLFMLLNSNKNFTPFVSVSFHTFTYKIDFFCKFACVDSAVVILHHTLLNILSSRSLSALLVTVINNKSSRNDRFVVFCAVSV